MRAVRYAAVLSLICVVSALGVAGTYRLTRQRIEVKEKNARVAAQKAVVPVGEGVKVGFRSVETEVEELKGQVAAAVDASGKVFGYAALGEAQGYSSRIKVMVGLDAKAEKIVGIKNVSQQETPGLGTNIAKLRSSKTIIGWFTGKKVEEEKDETPIFLKQFKGKRLDRIGLRSGGKGDIDAWTGATLSSRGTVNAARKAIEKIQKLVGKQSAGGDAK